MNGDYIVESHSRLEILLKEIDELTAAEKAELVSNLLRQQSGVNAIFGNGFNHVMRADLVVQINNSDTETIKNITDAIARRIEG